MTHTTQACVYRHTQVCMYIHIPTHTVSLSKFKDSETKTDSYNNNNCFSSGQNVSTLPTNKQKHEEETNPQQNSDDDDDVDDDIEECWERLKKEKRKKVSVK